MNLTIALIGLAATIVASIAALGAWQAATKANRSAEKMATIEDARRHVELTPQLRITCRAQSDDRADLVVSLDGPAGLDRLDEMTISIRDDRHDRGASPISGGPAAEQVAEVIWGPYRLAAGISGVDATGRYITYGQLRLGDWSQFSLQRTFQPPWQTDAENWRRQWQAGPVRLVIVCQREGLPSWTLPYEIEVQSGPRGQFL